MTATDSASEIQCLLRIQTEMQRECAKEMKAARAARVEADGWRVLCGEWKKTVIELQTKLQNVEERQPAFLRLFNAVAASPEPLRGEIAAAFYALRKQEFGG